MTVIEVTAGVDIDRPADEVFTFLADFENNPIWQRGMRSARFTSEPPLRVGSTYDQQATFLGKQVVSSFEVVDLEPGRSVTITSTAGTFPITVTRSVEGIGSDRTRVSALVRGDVSGVFRLAAPLLHRIVQHSVRGDYARLKRVLEADTH